MRVAAVIPHWNRRDLLEPLLDNLERQSRRFDEVIVVDNGSTDGSAGLAESRGARVLRLERNLGFAAAVNRGIQAADADWIAILNNDVLLNADWLERLLDAAQRESAPFATGKILSAADPATLDGTFDEISRAGCAWRCGAGKPDGPFWNQPGPIRMASMTAALFRRSLFEEIGRLDERFESYLEDVDFGIRCALAGRTGIYVPAAITTHRGSSTLGRWNRDTVRRIARNQIILFCKYLREQPRWPVLVGQLLWGLLALRHGRALAFLLGKIEGLRAARGMREQQRSADAVKFLLEESERHIFELQRQTGFELYWRLYFWLSRW